MRLLLLALAVALFQFCDCQEGNGPPAGEADEAKAVNPNSVSEENPSGNAAGGNGPPQQQQQASAAGANRRFFPSGGSQSSPSFCPKYSYYNPPSIPMCSIYARGRCPTRDCWRYVKTATVCKIPLEMHKGFWYRGIQCSRENQPCSRVNSYDCKCVTKVCWMRLVRLIKVIRGDLRKTLYYFIALYWRRPCGCDCRGRYRPTSPPFTVYPPWPTPWNPCPYPWSCPGPGVDIIDLDVPVGIQ